MTKTADQIRKPFLAGLAIAALLAFGGTAQAQGDDYGAEGENREVQLGLGIGLVDPEDADDAEKMFSGGVRIRIGQRNDDPVWDGDHYRGRPPQDNGIRGYIEPEVQYWSGGGDRTDIDDLLVGVNLVGEVPTRNADYYLGVGFGYHFFDAVIRDEDDVIVQEDDDGKLGGNLHVGVDINVSDSTALFGTGRVDILEGNIAERQTKVLVGLRLKF